MILPHQRKNLQQLPVVDSKMIVWSGDRGVAEESQIGRFVKRIWQDSCDVGFNVRSHKTGKVVAFVYQKTIGHADDRRDIFVSVDGNITITVIND